MQRGNQVGDGGAKAIAAALQQNSSVQWLELVRILDEFCGCFLCGEFGFAFSPPCVRANMSFAALQPSRRRGSEGYCCCSATEQQRASSKPCKMNFVVVFLCGEFGFAFSSPCVRADFSFAGRQPHRRRGSEGYCCRFATKQHRADAVPCKINFVVVFYVLNFFFLFHRRA